MPEDHIPEHVRLAVALRAGYCCEYCFCQADYTPDPLSVEHIYPRIRGGSSRLENLALACQGCNGRKYTSVDALDPVTGETVALFNPRVDHWNEHFAWSDDLSLLVAKTATGRATVSRLDLNRGPVVNLRRVLAAIGEHPPRAYRP